MPTRQRVRIPVFFRVLLTGMSAALVIICASAFTFVKVPASTTAYPVWAASGTPLRSTAQTLSLDAHDRHVTHLAHLTRLAAIAQAQAAAAYAAARPAQLPPAPAPAAAHQDSSPVAGAAVSTAGDGSMQACIISRESGGDSQVMNSTGHYGLYQFSYATWVAHGGNPADFGRASVAEQDQVYANAVAQDGYSDWAPYDGC